MAIWDEALKQAIRLLPELHRLMPLLERMTAPEMREEQRNRIVSAANAAAEARESAESARGSVIEATRRLSSQHAELMARLGSCEQKIKNLADAQSSFITKLGAAMVWIKTTAVLALIMIGLLIALLLRHTAQ